MAATLSCCSRSATQSASLWPWGSSGGSDRPSTVGSGASRRAGADSPWRTRMMSVPPGGSRKRNWRNSCSVTPSTLRGSGRHADAGFGVEEVELRRVDRQLDPVADTGRAADVEPGDQKRLAGLGLALELLDDGVVSVDRADRVGGDCLL